MIIAILCATLLGLLFVRQVQVTADWANDTHRLLHACQVLIKRCEALEAELAFVAASSLPGSHDIRA